ncbi:putative proteinase inhibitor I13, potato inhibitor I [Helianthus annuus]|uniref:Proteinase inhibitor I13 n=1 Tax=Helianthus annuus TaxID=4232 RepID=A0A251SX72_HELAN|nr:putative proteinase inhibitor I13, potato inhibitor I [Helianthus annuus]
MASTCEQVEQGKISWPELVGETGESAADVIENENRLVHTRIILEGTLINRLYICDRVLVWVNNKGITVRTPTIG